jgi:predicted RNase H-like HicB family nuclease
MNKPFYVHAEWDAEARVWVATSDEVAGLATEADTTEALVQKLKTLIPELLAANNQSAPLPIAFELLTRRFELAA